MHQHRPLVREYIEHLSRSFLEEHQALIRAYIRHRCGVYALYKGSRLHYVGLASNLTQRLKSHLRDHHAGDWDRFSVYLTKSDSHMKELESLLLRIAKPKGNSVAGRFASADDLRGRLTADVRRAQREQLHDLMGKKAKKRATKPAGTPTKTQRPLGGCFPRRRTLRARYRNKLLRATVHPDGRIIFNNRSYDSPSAAARAACGRARDGWRFWLYQPELGQWLPLDNLRA